MAMSATEGSGAGVGAGAGLGPSAWPFQSDDARPTASIAESISEIGRPMTGAWT
jgi:hypothetical protein